MFAPSLTRRDFADTRIDAPASAFGVAPPEARLPDAQDAWDDLEHAGRADFQLLRLVACCAFATLTLALVSSLA